MRVSIIAKNIYWCIFNERRQKKKKETLSWLLGDMNPDLSEMYLRLGLFVFSGCLAKSGMSAWVPLNECLCKGFWGFFAEMMN